MNKIAAILIVGLLAAPAMADPWPPPSPYTPYLAGDFNGWTSNGTTMTETSPGSNIWTASISSLGANGRHEFKVTDGTWNYNFPGPNSWLYADASGNISVTYDGNTYADGWSPTMFRIGENADPAAGFTAVGDWQHFLGDGDWNNANPFTAMAPQGNGVYMLQAVIPAGNWNWKAVATGTWDSISWDNRSVNTANWGFTTDAVNNMVTFWVNNLAGTVKIDITPEPATLALMLIGGLALLRRR
ncbi:MAG TPA: PEP-CTERM sorting domain-containing protein [Phycisphaerae bacterium]|nr:PEP-CTERM sorting domain-containing protein [Phycisphaerae bacterium]